MLSKITRPQEGLVIYPLNSSGTSLSVSVDTTTISLRYIADTTETEVIAYTGKNITDIASAINRSTIPVKANALSNAINLSAGDFISTSGYVLIPGQFTVHDRTSNNGVVLRLKKLTVKTNSQTNIRILAPYADSSGLPWYPRISVGSFTEKYKDRLYTFEVSDYQNQTWSLRYGKPFIDLDGITPTFLSSNSVQLPRSPVYWDGHNVLLYNGDVPISSTIIQDIDVNNGIVYFTSDFFANPESITVNYSYIERSYIYKHININTHFGQNPFLLNKYVVMYLIPTEASLATPSKKAVNHSIGDSIESAIDNIYLENPDIPVAILGAYALKEGSYDEVSILDTRVMGGGLIESVGPKSPVHPEPPVLKEEFRKIEETYKEASSFFDIGRYDGEVYPGAAAVIINIPDNVRDSLDEVEIRNKASKFLGAGIYPITSYYDTVLPGVTGASRQIAATINTGLNHTLSGAGWIFDNYTIPNSTFFDDWYGYSFTGNPSVQYIDNSYVVQITPHTGIFQHYLVSTPIIGMQWEERNVYYTSGESEEYIYGPWEEKTIISKTDISNNTLQKRTLSLTTDYGIKQYKNFVVSAPYRTDTTGEIKTKVYDIIDEITGSFSDKYGSERTFINYPVSYYVQDIANNILQEIPDYFGTHISNNFLCDVVTDTYASYYTGMFRGVSEDLTNAFSGLYPKFSIVPQGLFEVPDNGVQIDISDILYQLGRFTLMNKVVYGTGDSVYTGMKSVMNSFLSGLSGTSDYFLPEYIYDSSVTPVALTLPETNGYPKSEVYTGNNQDYRMLDMLPGVFSCMASYSSIAEASAAHTSLFSNIKNILVNQRTRIPQAISGFTYSGADLASSYYLEYDRYSSYLGNTIANLTKSYDSLYHFVTGNYSTPYTQYSSSAPGYTPQTLDLIFKTIETALNSGLTGVREHLARHGVVKPGILNVVKGYGWYMNHYADHTGKYQITTLNESTLSGYRELYEIGTLSVLKGSITSEGYFHETTLIDNGIHRFDTTVPTLIFQTLAEGCAFDPDKYIPYTEAALNTLTGLYNYSGVYYSDPTLFDPAGGKEYSLINTMAILGSKL